MNPRDLYREGRLTAAVEALNAEVRDHPTDVQRRTFLFELLSFAGDYERAGKQLDVLARMDPEAALGIIAYKHVIESERERAEMFASGAFPEPGDPLPRPVRGTLNGRPFERLEDADPRIGPRLEVFIEGQYRWFALEHLASVRMEAPQRLRDLLWGRVQITGGEPLGGVELGDALVPALTASASSDPDDEVRLGRVTRWVELPGGSEAPVGQKMLLVDDEEFPILELRELDIDGPSET